MLSWQCGAKKLGAGALAKLCEEEKPKAKSAFLVILHKWAYEQNQHCLWYYICLTNNQSIKYTHQDITLIRAVRLGVKLYGALLPACFQSRRGCPYSVRLWGISKRKCQPKSLLFWFILEKDRKTLYITLIFDVLLILFVKVLGVFRSSLGISCDENTTSVWVGWISVSYYECYNNRQIHIDLTLIVSIKASQNLLDEYICRPCSLVLFHVVFWWIQHHIP